MAECTRSVVIDAPGDCGNYVCVGSAVKDVTFNRELWLEWWQVTGELPSYLVEKAQKIVYRIREAFMGLYEEELTIQGVSIESMVRRLLRPSYRWLPTFDLGKDQPGKVNSWIIDENGHIFSIGLWATIEGILHEAEKYLVPQHPNLQFACSGASVRRNMIAGVSGNGECISVRCAVGGGGMSHKTSTVEPVRDSPPAQNRTRMKSTPERQTIRLSLDVSPELNEKLQQLAYKTRGTKSEVLRRAIALYEVAINATEQGKKVGVAEPDQVLRTEFVGL